MKKKYKNTHIGDRAKKIYCGNKKNTWKTSAYNAHAGAR
jgi:hypothetical protein